MDYDQMNTELWEKAQPIVNLLTEQFTVDGGAVVSHSDVAVCFLAIVMTAGHQAKLILDELH